jgi:uncharacterized protein YuzE
MPLTAEYDPEADALYVRLADGERQRAVEIDDSTYVDVDADGRPIGLELLYPSLGINLLGAARRFALEQQLGEMITAIVETGAPVAPPTMTGGQFLASTTIIRVAVEGTVAAARGVVSPGVGHVGVAGVDPIFRTLTPA